MENLTGRAVDPATSHAKTQRETGNTTASAQSGGVISAPQFTDVNVKGNLTLNVNNTSVQSAAETNETDVVSPKTKEKIQRCQTELKAYLQNETRNLFQGTEEAGSSVPLNKIYTDLYITEGGAGEVNTEHEVIELECTRYTSEEKKIHLNNIFDLLPNEEDPPQRILTKGIAGIGKTVAVQKFTHDWAAGTANQTIQYIFPFTFRDLNLIKDTSFSLIDLIGNYFKEVRDLETSDYENSRVLFIFDGLDESKFPLDFKNNELCRSVTKATTVDALLTNLIKGKLLHKALVWITSRPAAASKIDPKFIGRVTEVRGFNDEQKEEYFKKKICDNDMAQKIIGHLQSKPLRSLYIMCHIPVFCWISATALQSLLSDPHESELPKTVTEMYTHFLIIQTKQKQQKDYQDGEADRDLIMKLAKLAFEQLQKGNIIFYEKDLTECNIDLKQAAVYSGICTQIIRKENGLHRKECYSFVHLSVQEFLAALYVLEIFIDSGKNLLPTQKWERKPSEKGEIPISFLHRRAVVMALKNDHGQWDLFLRFLLGLSQDKNQKLLQHQFGFKERCSQSNQQTIKYIHDKVKKLSYTDKSINLFHCLNELGDQSLVEQVQSYQRSGDVSKISPAHWSALAYVLLVSNEDLCVFDLRKYCRSDEVLERLVPLLKASKTALLSDCNLTDRCCRCISSVLSLKSSGLEELDLSRNNLHDSGMRLLSDGLKSPNCKVQRLSLNECSITTQGCQSLASGLTSNSSHLRELDLSKNEIHDEGLQLLSEVLNKCSLESLRLCECGLTQAGGKLVASALSLNPSHLKNLDLSRNRFGDQAVAQLERLGLFKTELGEKCAAALASALALNPSHLRELDLGGNELGDAGVKKIAALLKHPNCKVETLRLCECGLTQAGGKLVASALSLNPSHLKNLDLSRNRFGDQAVAQLCDFLKHPDCQLERLGLFKTELGEKCAAALASALALNPSHLRELDLGGNELGDAGVKKIAALLKHPNCKVETLRLCDCGLTQAGGKLVASALSLNPSHLKNLDLSGNRFGDQAVAQLCDFLKHPDCQLERLGLFETELGEKCAAALASALALNPSHLRELDLGGNELGDAGVKKIAALLKDPNCKVETLSLRCCTLTTACCRPLTLALSRVSALKELDLSCNHLEDQGVRLLSDWLKKPQCRLEKLRLFKTELGESCASALALNPSHLRELDLGGNELGDAGVKKIAALLKHPNCKVETLSLRCCTLTTACCRPLTLALSRVSALKELDLSYNHLKDQGVRLLSDWLKKPQCRLEILRLSECTEDGCEALASALSPRHPHFRELELRKRDPGKAGLKLLSDVQKDKR